LDYPLADKRHHPRLLCLHIFYGRHITNIEKAYHFKRTMYIINPIEAKASRRFGAMTISAKERSVA
jgi:hypothetical protein